MMRFSRPRSFLLVMMTAALVGLGAAAGWELVRAQSHTHTHSHSHAGAMEQGGWYRRLAPDARVAAIERQFRGFETTMAEVAYRYTEMYFGALDANWDYAEHMATTLGNAWSGDGTLDAALAAHETARNERVRPMYEFSTELAALEPAPPEMRALFGALHGNQDATNAFFSAITGAIPLPDFMSRENIERIMAAATTAESHA